jgi:hypothetical protein
VLCNRAIDVNVNWFVSVTCLWHSQFDMISKFHHNMVTPISLPSVSGNNTMTPALSSSGVAWVGGWPAAFSSPPAPSPLPSPLPPSLPRVLRGWLACRPSFPRLPPFSPPSPLVPPFGFSGLELLSLESCHTEFHVVV